MNKKQNGKSRGQAAIESACGPTARRLKGQAAMEYLMTYGWALLVIVIVIFILLFINPLKPPEGCRFDTIGFTCNAPLVDSNGTLYLTFTNGNSNNIEIWGLNCTTDRTTKPPAFDAAAHTVAIKSLQRQEPYELQSATHGGIQCYDAKNAKLQPSAGSDFTGRLWVFYKNEEDGSNYPMRSTSATVTTTVVQASS